MADRCKHLIFQEWLSVLMHFDFVVSSRRIYVHNSRGSPECTSNFITMAPKEIYETCNRSVDYGSSSIKKWFNTCHMEEDLELMGNWRRCFSLPHSVAWELEQNFWYKIQNNTLPCQYFLNQFRVATSPNCLVSPGMG